MAVRPPGLLSGMYVTVRIPVESPTRLLRVPLEAVRPGGQIWVKRNQTLVILQATPAYTFDDHALLRAAECELAVGDEVIISPLASVTSDLRVMTREEQQVIDDQQLKQRNTPAEKMTDTTDPLINRASTDSKSQSSPSKETTE